MRHPLQRIGLSGPVHVADGPPDRPQPASVLVYTGEDTVGDGLVKLPFVRELRHRLPGAHITWCAGIGPCAYARALKPLVADLIDEVIEAPGLGTSPLQILSPSRPLAGRRFDLVIDTQKAVLRTLAVRRIRHGAFVSAAAGFRFSDLKPAPDTVWPQHFVKGLIALLDLAVPADGAGEAAPTLAVDAALSSLAERLLPTGPVYVGISPGAGDRSKCWPLESFIALARLQAARGRTPVFFVGPEERDWLPHLRAEAPDALFPEWDEAAQKAEAGGPAFAITLARRLTAAVANDSGTGHMLAAGGAPLVSIFSKHDPEKYAPFAARLEIVDSKPLGGTDPALIPVDTVADAVERLLAEA